jgi:hypothetical protein
MDINRVKKIRRMVEVWAETDSYEEDYAKTEVIEELILEIDQYQSDVIETNRVSARK